MKAHESSYNFPKILNPIIFKLEILDLNVNPIEFIEENTKRVFKGHII